MPRFTMAYCSVCGAQVKTERSEDDACVTDSTVYCKKCRPSKGDAPAVVSRTPRPQPAVRGTGQPRSGGTRVTHKGGLPPAAIYAGAGVVLVLVVGAWYAMRSNRTDSPTRQDDPAAVAKAHTPTPSVAPKADPPPVAKVDPPKPEKDPLEGEITQKPPEKPAEKPPEKPADPPKEPEKKPDPPAQPKSDALSPDDLNGIRAAEGKQATVQGLVQHVKASKTGSVTWIAFNNDKNGFEAVVFEKKMAAFEKQFGNLQGALTGKTVAIHGKVSNYKGRMQIILDDPSQIEVK